MQRIHHFSVIKTGIAVITLTTLVACGGGGSSSGSYSSQAPASSSLSSASPSSSSASSVAMISSSSLSSQASSPASSSSSESSAVSSSESSVAAGVTLQDLQAAIFTPRCSGCHAGASAPRGLRLDSEQNSFDFLVSQAADEVPSMQRVNPGNPDASYLVLKIEGAPTIVGGRMPLGGTPLTTAEINQVRDWISNGAPRTGTGALSTKVRVAEIAKTGRNIAITLRFTRAVESEQALGEKVQLYFASAQGQWLAASDTYSLTRVDDQSIGISIQLLDESATSLELLVNDPTITAILDVHGRVIDGDGDELDGGIYRYQYEI